VPDKKAWHEWLEKNHERSEGVWLLYLKGRAATNGVSYDESVEEALCFGWIDSQIRRIDGTKYARKFTPRRPGSWWSPSNIERIERLTREGRMAEAGLRRVEEAKENGSWEAPREKARNVPVPASLLEELAENPRAKENFEALARSYRDDFSAWIAAAKTDATRRARIAEALEKLERNEKLGLK